MRLYKAGMHDADHIDELIALTNRPLDLTEVELCAWRAIQRQSRRFKGEAATCPYSGTMISADAVRLKGDPVLPIELLAKTTAAGRRVVKLVISGWADEVDRVANDPAALRRILDDVPMTNNALPTNQRSQPVAYMVAGECLKHVHLQIARQVKDRARWSAMARRRTLDTLHELSMNDFADLAWRLGEPEAIDGMISLSQWRQLVGKSRSAFHDRLESGQDFHCPAHPHVNRLFTSGALYRLNLALVAEVARRSGQLPMRRAKKYIKPKNVATPD